MSDSPSVERKPSFGVRCQDGCGASTPPVWTLSLLPSPRLSDWISPPGSEGDFYPQAISSRQCHRPLASPHSRGPERSATARPVQTPLLPRFLSSCCQRPAPSHVSLSNGRIRSGTPGLWPGRHWSLTIADTPRARTARSPRPCVRTGRGVPLPHAGSPRVSPVSICTAPACPGPA